jgi:hypothetical protein
VRGPAVPDSADHLYLVAKHPAGCLPPPGPAASFE